MSQLLAAALVGVLKSMITSAFLSKIMIYMIKAWTDSTENKYDDMVTAAMAEALAVDLKAESKLNGHSV